MTFTGRRRFRLEGGLLVLQLEYRQDTNGTMYYQRDPMWKDATVEDITTENTNEDQNH